MQQNPYIAQSYRQAWFDGYHGKPAPELEAPNSPLSMAWQSGWRASIVDGNAEPVQDVAPLILTKEQATVVYASIRAMDRVGGTVKCTLDQTEPGSYTIIFENVERNILVRVVRNFNVQSRESYESAEAFAIAYQLNEV